MPSHRLTTTSAGPPALKSNTRHTKENSNTLAKSVVDSLDGLANLLSKKPKIEWNYK